MFCLSIFHGWPLLKHYIVLPCCIVINPCNQNASKNALWGASSKCVCASKAGRTGARLGRKGEGFALRCVRQASFGLQCILASVAGAAPRKLVVSQMGSGTQIYEEQSGGNCFVPQMKCCPSVGLCCPGL